MTLAVAQNIFTTLRRQGWLIEIDERRTGVRGRVVVQAKRGIRVLMCDAPSVREAAECLRRLDMVDAAGVSAPQFDAA